LRERNDLLNKVFGSIIVSIGIIGVVFQIAGFITKTRNVTIEEAIFLIFYVYVIYLGASIFVGEPFTSPHGLISDISGKK
jgi:hypothetical protein